MIRKPSPVSLEKEYRTDILAQRIGNMNVLFLTLIGFDSLQEKNIYTDLLREFAKNGHQLYVISPVEKRSHLKTHLIKEENARILRLQIGNAQKTNIIEKGVSTIRIGPAFQKAIKQYFADVKFDLILYSTPPITLVDTVEYVKKRDGAKTYLLLKDIFPQNAVDMGMLRTTGLKGILYRHFRKQEKKLYQISDRIGCMSQANVDYVIKHNPDVDPSIVEICPNSVEVIDKCIDEETRIKIRVKYKIPVDKKVFVYGGNLGRPQGIPFIIESLKKCEKIRDAFFLIVGDGTEYHLLNEYMETERPENVKLMKSLSKEDYDKLVGACDVGMIFLDHRFTIPNFPSRLLVYMQSKIPVLVCTDSNSDVGKEVVEGEYGLYCESNDKDGFVEKVKEFMKMDISTMGENGYRNLIEKYSVSITYKIIVK